MHLKILFIYTLLLGNNIYAQKKDAPPPPPPRRESIVAADQTDILKTDGFKIEFPGKPSRSVAPVETAYGKTNMVSYRLMTNMAFYNVNYLDFPTVITDKSEISLRFAAVKAALTKDATDRLLSETEISFGGNSGIEYVIEGKDTTLTTRCLFIQQRFFQLVVVTKGRQSKSTARVNAFNRRNVEQFINSFYVNELPKPQTTAVELPENFGIEINNSIFTSQFFGFSIKLPENWRVVDKEQTNVLKDLTVQEVGNSSEKTQKALDFSLKNTEILLFATKADVNAAVNTSVFAIAAERVSFPNFDPKAIAESFQKNFFENDDVMSKKTTATKISGVEFWWFEIENKKENIKKRFYFANRKGIALQLLMIYQNEVELRTMLDSLATVRFSQGG